MGIKAAQRDRLQRAVSGAVLLPGEGGHADATRTWDLAAGSCPPVALVAASAADIAAGARWAKENDLDIAMLNTGHGALDHNAGALVINALRVNQTAVDSSTRRAIVGPGTCWADVSAATAPLGLTGLAGASPGVGVIGYTLGGGLSPIGRTFGFASPAL
jgi:FAD/FMN-containing dehydrogenase